MAKFNYGDLREQALARYVIDEDGNVLGSVSSPGQVDVPDWHYIGREFITANGEVEATLPADAVCIVLEARGGAVHYEINASSCSTNSPYVAADGRRTIGPLSNLSSFWVYGSDATTYAHLQYFRKA